MDERCVSLRQTMAAVAESGGGAQAAEDALALAREMAAGDAVVAAAFARFARQRALADMAGAEGRDVERLYRAVEGLLRLFAASDFDSYMLFMEWAREPSKRFYQPRRRVLYRIVRDLQDLFDGKLEFLSVSLPPRTGKSTLCIFFLTFVMGNAPTRANVMSGHSDKLTKGFHLEALSIISDTNTYRFAEVFPSAPLVDKSMADETIHLGKRSRFPTLTCRSIDGTLTGAVEVGKGALLYCDDLVSDREEALNAERMDKLYAAYLNQLKDRMNDGARQLFVATRWCTNDPIGRIAEDYGGNPRYRFVGIPALDGVPAEEWVEAASLSPAQLRDAVARDGAMALVRRPLGLTNFTYDHGLGYSTAYYMDMRESLVAAGEADSWEAKYMAAPYDVGGRLFPEDELRTFAELPEGEPDAVLAVCDTKDRGVDFACQPIDYVYGDDHYIVSATCDDGMPETVEPRLAEELARWRVQVAQYESNSAGGRVADSVREKCEALGWHVEMRKKFSTSNKETRILVDSGWVKARCLFWEVPPDAEYDAFMRQLHRYTADGKAKHDDAPDAMSMLRGFSASMIVPRVSPMKRPW